MRTTTLKTIAAAAALAVATGLAAAAPAAAETQTHRDARGDVETLTFDRAAPKPDIDIVGGQNTFRARKLTLTLDFADLQRNGYQVQWFIRTPEEPYLLTLDRSGPEQQVAFFAIRDIGRAPGGPGIQPICDGDDVDVERAGDSLTGTVPRRCIGGASEVRIAAVSADRRSETSNRIDDARRKGIAEGRQLRYGPVLERN